MIEKCVAGAKYRITTAMVPPMHDIIIMFFGYKNSVSKALVLYKVFAALSPRLPSELILDTGRREN